jgi:hypothetical protein
MRRSPVRETNGLNHFTRLSCGAGIPCEEVGDRRGPEELIDAAGDLLPPVVGGARIGVTAGGAADETPSFADRLEWRDDAREGEAVRGRDEAKAAARPALGAEDAGASEEVEGFGEIVARAP